MKRITILESRPRAPALALMLATPALALLLSACGGGGSDPVPVSRPTEAVPPAVSTSPTTAAAYTSSLADTPPAEAETLEPVALPDQMATDDSAEPA